ncbi:hypothetical protein A3K82_00420 [Candidatus Pacearchaeota archaeon RBG_19FT_COMBO_34_9]|nr:MAG: hypothetical protein A3K82_00420 [Candidatus Pacearchaeota archaeon RBG_19FT_COMBO_34_9]OGJ16230.1 MAG: hypothetical protein A3K74_03325 [Candidatus Pacearchaeota archaeon RBG_13_33_26]
MKKKVGIVVLFRLDSGGGAPKVTIDLINALNHLGMEVFLLNPFNMDYKKIEEFYGSVKIEKVYSIGGIKSFFCREEYLGRKLMKKEFQKMAKEVDFIIDIDGGVFHNYLPKGFNKSNYVIWRISCINPETSKLQNYVNSKMIIKKIIRSFSFKKQDIPTDIKVYPVDKWTEKEIIENWKMVPQETCLYQEVKTDKFISDKKKENLVVILGRIAPNKSLDDSIKIFAHGTGESPDYKLIIIGGATPDSDSYILKLSNLAKELGISERVKIIENPSFVQIRDILSKSNVLIDSQIGTSINIPPIEAMASGCIILMRKNSGTYTELLENGKYGYGFENAEEGAERLKEILRGLKEKKINNKESIKRSMDFSEERFNRTVEKILNEM